MTWIDTGSPIDKYRKESGASGLGYSPQASRPSRSGPTASEPSPISRDEQPREKGAVDLTTRALAQALRAQRVVIVESRTIPGGTYAIIKVKNESAGMDPRTRAALETISQNWPTLSRNKLTRAAPGVGYVLTHEGYTQALALLAPLLRPRVRGETPRWKPGVDVAQVSQLIDTLTKTKTGP